MNKIIAFSALSLLLASPALAQESGQSGHATSGGQAPLPAACREAASKNIPQPTGLADDAMANMDDVQKANMKAMMRMNGPMMRAMTIKDPDLAFNCGMIPHHQGAIAMAEVELKMGKDKESRKLARRIIEAQKKEIAAMTAWVKQHDK